MSTLPLLASARSIAAPPAAAVPPSPPGSAPPPDPDAVEDGGAAQWLLILTTRRTSRSPPFGLSQPVGPCPAGRCAAFAASHALSHSGLKGLIPPMPNRNISASGLLVSSRKKNSVLSPKKSPEA